tara:strand:+ start:1047 stop:1406 length:360 start_codon:yes stop_codon:yes gene_type:complete
MYLLISLICFLIFIFLIRKSKKLLKKRNKKLINFKNKLISKESKIDKIFLRDEEKTSSDPNINIKIDINENEENILRKANIHRARLAKYKKSKLNGELIFEDSDNNIYKLVRGKKVFIK